MPSISALIKGIEAQTNQRKILRVLFDRNKIRDGVMHACQKRPVDAEAIAAEIEVEIMNSLRREIPSREIGELAMEKLKKRDAVAYVRFASVYREFKDVETFMKELQGLKADPDEAE